MGNQKGALGQNFVGKTGFGGQKGGFVPGGGGKGPETRSCYKCGGQGHIARNCPNASVPVWKKGQAGGKGGQGGAAAAVGGNPNSKLLCRNYAQTGKCRFGANCKFKHVYGSVGCLAAISQQAQQAGREIPASMISDDVLTYDASVEGYCIAKDHEIDVCCRIASEAEILESGDIADMKSYFLEEESAGFRRQP